ncbi:hypothetical protein [Clostridium lacusfryxellense]|uniref:hypothetical protein n=1 Tax=Clostridium lacusfryxellense TaxID=205328 RepID=UPI001C0B235E|nr:hypothetical protein [Clostridium lacusfryxellense]MBU3113555.1 hypothetical protein [Clostridium lacusfryxellense]
MEKGVTKKLNKGDELVFRQILTNNTSPVEMYYYERMTDVQIITPQGETVLLNSLGMVGQSPMMYFAFKQEENNDIYFYGSIFSKEPVNEKNIIKKEWVIEPAEGRCLNYPGLYTVGYEWDYKFQVQESKGKLTEVNLHNIVEKIEQITTALGKFECYVINAYNNSGELDSISWFSSELGVNVKRLSYSDMKPGYELTEYRVGGVEICI